MDTVKSFGCAQCFGGDPEELWDRSPWRHDQNLLDDSHNDVALFTCETCGQRFLHVFTEFINWSGGNDSQYWDVVPITDEEARTLVEQWPVPLEDLGQFGAGRKRLQVSFPSRGGSSMCFATGTFEVREGG